ncbi:MAG: ABC transporter substrate-binding protein [Alphaproteobacteria bacterium]
MKFSVLTVTLAAASIVFAAGVLLVRPAHAATTFVYCSEGSPEGFDTALYTSGTTFDASSRTLYNRLVHFVPGMTETTPGLAESWTISDDGLEYTFNLRSGVKFHTTDWFTPTRDFNADDVVFSFKRQHNPNHAWHQYVGGTAWEYFNGMSMPDLLADIVRVDDSTVKFILTRPEAPMIANLAMDFASIVSAEYAAQLEAAGTQELFNQQPVGTGPFQLVNYQQDASIRYKAHPDYYKGKQAIDNLVFSIATDASVRQQKLLSGECHLMPYPNPADITSLMSTDGITVIEQEGLNVGYLAFNTQVAPFNDVRVRKALSSAVNKQAIIDAVFQGKAQAATNPIPPTMWSYNRSVKDDQYDPEAARRLLAEAGVSDLSMEVWAMPVQRPYNPNARRMAELIQADYADIGVDVEIVSYEWGEYLDRSKSVDRSGAVLLGWTGDNGDPDNFLAVLLGCDGVGGSNRAQWCDSEFEELIQDAKTISDKGERTRLYEQAQVVFKREAPWVTIAHSITFTPMSNKVRGYKVDPLGIHSFEGVSLAE